MTLNQYDLRQLQLAKGLQRTHDYLKDFDR